jgi:hypothetical protein
LRCVIVYYICLTFHMTHIELLDANTNSNSIIKSLSWDPISKIYVALAIFGLWNGNYALGRIKIPIFPNYYPQAWKICLKDQMSSRYQMLLNVSVLRHSNFNRIAPCVVINVLCVEHVGKTFFNWLFAYC